MLENNCVKPSVKFIQQLSGSGLLPILTLPSMEVVRRLTIPNVNVGVGNGQTIFSGEILVSNSVIVDVGFTSVDIIYQILRDDTVSLTNGEQLVNSPVNTSALFSVVPIGISVVDTDVEPGIHSYTLTLRTVGADFFLNVLGYSLRVETLSKPLCNKKGNYLLPYVSTNQLYSAFPIISSAPFAMTRLGTTTLRIPEDTREFVKVKSSCGKVIISGTIIVFNPSPNIILPTPVPTSVLIQYNITRDGKSIINGTQILYQNDLSIAQVVELSINAVDTNVPKGDHVYAIILTDRSATPLYLQSYSFYAKPTESLKAICCGDKCDPCIKTFPLYEIQNFPTVQFPNSLPLVVDTPVNLEFPKICIKNNATVVLTGTVNIQTLESLLTVGVTLDITYNIYRDGVSLFGAEKQLISLALPLVVVPPLTNLNLPIDINFVDSNVPKGEHTYLITLTSQSIAVGGPQIGVGVYSLRAEVFNDFN